MAYIKMYAIFLSLMDSILNNTSWAFIQGLGYDIKNLSQAKSQNCIIEMLQLVQ